MFCGGRGDILDEGCLESMNELEWRRKIGGCVLLIMNGCGFGGISLTRGAMGSIISDMSKLPRDAVLSCFCIWEQRKI